VREAATVVKNAALGLTIPIYEATATPALSSAQALRQTGMDSCLALARARSVHLRKPTPGVQALRLSSSTTKACRAALTPSTFAGHAYDALYLVTDAAKKIDGEITGAKLRDQIEKTSGFPGIGGVFTFSATDHTGLSEKDMSFYEIKDGAFVLAPQ
jgi:branched-chain amino acid transport system substrate-binding protein